jgi:hypothetical protein
VALVFVHGVNVRKGDVYDREIAFRNLHFAEVLYPQLGKRLDQNAIFNPYWGDLGASLSNDYPFLPRGAYQMLWKRRDSLGAQEIGESSQISSDQDAEEGGVLLDPSAPLLSIVRNASLEDGIDLLWSFIEDDSNDPETAVSVARLAQRALNYIHTDEGRQWLDNLKSDDELLERLMSFLLSEMPASVAKTPNHKQHALSQSVSHSVAAPKTGVERASLGGFLQKARERLSKRVIEHNARLKESFQDIRHRVRKSTVGTTAKVFNEPLRAMFHKQSALLIGDAFSYFSSRGDSKTAAPIAERVIESLREAHKIKQATGEELVVIGHSMGGVILCDIVTCYGKEIPIDVLITVGSQYPLFADLQMFPGISGVPRPIQRPENVKRWFNIIDPHDFLGYPASHIFDGVDDYHLPTYSLGAASHTDYFNRPSFYFQLARRLSDYLPCK